MSACHSVKGLHSKSSLLCEMLRCGEADLLLAGPPLKMHLAW